MKLNSKALWVVIAIVVGIGLVFFGRNLSKKQDNGDTHQVENEVDVSGTPTDTLPALKKKSASEPAPPVDMSPPADSSKSFVPPMDEDPKLHAMWEGNLKEMAKCLNMPVKPLSKGDVTFETINQAINTDLGEVVAQYDEWTATDIKTADGEIRRVFIKYDNNNEPPTKTVTYYTYKNGKQEQLPLTREQSENPSETAIASLEGDGRVFGQTASRRMAYINGDDIVVTEKNGRVYSYSLHHDGAHFSCSGGDKSTTLKCLCKEFQNEQ